MCGHRAATSVLGGAGGACPEISHPAPGARGPDPSPLGVTCVLSAFPSGVRSHMRDASPDPACCKQSASPLSSCSGAERIMSASDPFHEPALTRRQRRDRTARALEASGPRAARPVARSCSTTSCGSTWALPAASPAATSTAASRRTTWSRSPTPPLTRAARDFDPGRHEDFLSYAVPTIRGELKKHFRDLGWTVRPPRGSRRPRPGSRGRRASCVQVRPVARGRRRSPSTWVSSSTT